MIDFVKKHFPFLLSLIVLMSVFVMLVHTINTQTDIISVQLGQISVLTENLHVADTLIQKKQHDVAENASGLSYDRQKQDDIIAIRFFQDLFGWDSFESYNLVREKMMRVYDIKENSHFMQTVLPKVHEVTFGDKKINDIDVFGLNLEYIRMKSYVTSVSTNEYAYLAEVLVRTTSKGHSADGVMLFSYKISSGDVVLSIEKEIFDIDAYTIY